MSKMAARRSLALASDDLIAVVNGGSWGVGSIIHAARSVAATGASVYVLCGHSRKLAAAVSKLAGCRAVGWTNDVAIWIKAADVLVGSAGGTTCWEAIVAATPVILHRPLAGHGRLNAATLAAAGLVTVTSTEQEIATAIELLRRPKLAEVVHGVDAADAVLAAA
jgi:UDP-N-acetylglucosamine:LPS N-acetylglucosamine transferase